MEIPVIYQPAETQKRQWPEGVINAFAEAGAVDVFLTTDDRLLHKAKQNADTIKITVENPIIWLISTLQNEAETNETNGN